jgi:hypothetical protein
VKELKKTGDFISHFLQMVEVYVKDISEEKLSRKLKRGWKWVKDVVKEWDGLKEKARKW